jgi:hypothetical protein
VDTTGVLKSFSHPSDKLHPLSDGVFCQDVAEMLKLLPRKVRTLLIADIQHGFRLAGPINDEELYKYAQLDKMVKDFAQLTTAPLWRVLIFYSPYQTYNSVTKALQNICHAMKGMVICLFIN